MRRGNKPGRTSVLSATPGCQANATMRSAGLVSTATCCLAWFLREPTSPSRTGGTSTTGTLGPREHGSGARPPHKAAPADGSPRSPQRAPPMAAGSAPSIEEGHDTCVAHAQGSEAFALSARPQILFLQCQDEKGEEGAGASWFPRWPRAAIPGVVPRTGQLHR